MEFLQYILDLGPSVMLPIVIIILGLALGLKLGKAIYSGLSIGIGFIGIGLVVGLMLDSFGPAAKAMAENFGINLTIIDVGWPGMSPITWASSIALVAIPVAIITNIVMLVLNLTKVVNVDIWNIWHMTFTGAILYAVTNNYYVGILGVVIHSIFAYKFGDWFTKETSEYFELEGIAIPHGTSAYCAPFAVIIDSLIDKIPVLNKIDINTEKLEEKVGAFGQPIVVGFILGIFIGVFAKYDFQNIVQLAIKVSAVMYLMPKVIKPIMEGLMPISEITREKLSNKFKDKEFLIGLDPALLLGDSNVISAGLLFIPLTILIAMIIPNNRVLPFGDLATIGFFVAMATAIHKGNIFRTLISGSFIMAITIYITNQMVKYTTILANNANAIKAGEQLAAMDQGGCPITYALVQIITKEDIVGLIIIGTIYVIGLFMVWSKYKKYIKNR